MATKLKNLKVTSVDLVPAGANPDAHVRLFKSDAPTKTESGEEYPAAAYAYVPDPKKPSTWKLRLWEDPDKKVTAKQVGMAVAALGAGFRGNKADIPADDLPDVKAKVLAAWKRANPDASDDDVPAVLKKGAESGFGKRLLIAIAKLVGIPDEQIEKAAGDAETFGDTYADRMAAKQCEAACNEAWDMCYAMQQSICSILQDGSLDADGRSAALKQSLVEFDTAFSTATANWSQGTPSGKVAKAELTPKGMEMLKAQKQRIADLLSKADSTCGAGAAGTTGAGDAGGSPGNSRGGNNAGSKPAGTGIETPAKKGVVDTMKIDKSKMTPEELAQFEAFEKKYGAEDGTGDAGAGAGAGEGGAASGAAGGAADGGVAKGTDGKPELNPEVKKALEEIEALKGQLTLQEQVGVAKRYEVLGKKPEELAKKLVDLKKAGGTAYADYVALLDEQVGMVEKSGLFHEVGSSSEGSASARDAVEKAAGEVMKADPRITKAAAIAKACELHPELLAEYDKSYAGR